MRIQKGRIRRLVCFVFAMLIAFSGYSSVFAAVEPEVIVYSSETFSDFLDEVGRDAIQSIYARKSGEIFEVFLNGEKMGNYSGNNFSLYYNSSGPEKFLLSFHGMNTDFPSVDISYERESIPSVPKTENETVTAEISHNEQTVSVGGKTYSCREEGNGYVCEGIKVSLSGIEALFTVKLAGGKAYVVKPSGETLSFSGLSSAKVYLEWWVPAQLIQADYLASGLPMFDYYEAKNHTYTTSQIDKALENYSITMINNATGETKQALLKTDLTYWARNEGAGTSVGDGTYTEYQSGTRVVKQWSELSESQKSYFAGNYSDKNVSQRLFAVYPTTNKYCTIQTVSRSQTVIGDWGPWESVRTPGEGNENTEYRVSGYTKTVKSNVTDGWEDSLHVTSCQTQIPTTDENGLRSGSETTCSGEVKYQEQTVTVGAWDKGNERFESSCVPSASKTCTSGYLKKTRDTIVGAWDKNSSFSESCTPSQTKSCVSGAGERTRPVTVGAWNKDGSYVTSCTSSQTTSCEAGYYLKKTRNVTVGTWSKDGDYATSCTNSATTSCTSGYYRKTYTEVSIGSWTTYGGWQSGSVPSSSVDEQCTKYYKKVTTSSGSCSYGTAYNQTCDNCSTTRPSSGTYRTVYRYGCGSTSKSDPEKYYYDSTSASTGTKNATVCSSTYPWVASKKTYYQKQTCSGGSSSTSYTDSCSATSSVSCTAGYRCRTRSVSKSTSYGYGSTCTKDSAPGSSSSAGSYEYVSACTSGYYAKSTRSVSTGNWSSGTFSDSCSASEKSVTNGTASGTYTDVSCSPAYYKMNRSVTTGNFGGYTFKSSCSPKTNTITAGTNAGTYYDIECKTPYYEVSTRSIETGDWVTGYSTTCSVSSHTITGSTNAGTYTDTLCTPGYFTTERSISYGDWGNTQYRLSCPSDITHTITENTNAGTYTNSRCYSGYFAKSTRNWSISERSEESSQCTEGKTTNEFGVVITSCRASQWQKRSKGNKEITRTVAVSGAPEILTNKSVMTEAEINSWAKQVGRSQAQCDYLDSLDPSDPGYFDKADYDTGLWKTMITDKDEQMGSEAFLSQKIFIPYVYITNHWRATTGNTAYTGSFTVPITVSPQSESQTEKEGQSVTVPLERWEKPDEDTPGTDPTPPPVKPPERETRVIYYDYRDPLANYSEDNIPSNWKGYESLVSEIQKTDFGKAKICVRLSEEDIEEMRKWLDENPDKIGSCEMLRKFSHVFSGSDTGFLDFLRNSQNSCRA